MSESREGYSSSIQERSEWYQVNSFLLELGQTESELDLNPEDIVHVGGTANFYRCYQAFGPKTVFHFRGTHDMDVVCFNQGSVQRTLDELKEKGQSVVADYSVRKSSSLPDKKSIYVKLNNKSNPGLSTGFEIDVYESGSGVIRFNDHLMTRGKIVLDPPEVLELKTNNPRKTRGLVSVPSLRDAFIIKMDIVDYSRSGLRQKDELDILTTLSICKALGRDFEELLDAVGLTSSPHSFSMKLKALEQVFSKFKTGGGLKILGSDLLPGLEDIDKILASVRKRSSYLAA